MTRKWVEQEGQTWIDKQIITDQQYEEIVALYPPHKRRLHLLPILASILLGLSLLTFVASNWTGLSHPLKWIILLLTMVGFYTSGAYLYQRGNEWLGQGLLGLGVVSFGASIILAGQMYHLIAYDARLFVLWALAAIGLLYLLRRSFFFYLSSVLILGGQIYAMLSFGQSSYLLLALTVIGLGWYAWQTNQVSFGLILSHLFGIQIALIIFDQGWALAWLSIVPFILYVIGIWLGERRLALGFKISPIIFGFVFAVVMVFAHRYSYSQPEFFPQPIVFISLFLLLLTLTFIKIKLDIKKWIPVFLFLPFFYLSFGDVMYLIAMFVYSSFLIYTGDKEEHVWKANLGVFFFLVSSVIGYFQLAWAFMNKSIFFLFGAVLLFVIHRILQRRDRWLARGDEQS